MTEKEEILEKLRYVNRYTGHQKVLETVNEAINFIEKMDGQLCLCPKCTINDENDWK